MEEGKVKKTLIDLETVRIVEADDLNVIIERLEKSINPITKVESEKWKVKGYYGTIQGALKAIVKNELLIDNNAINDLETYCKKVSDSIRYILEVIDEIEVGDDEQKKTQTMDA